MGTVAVVFVGCLACAAILAWHVDDGGEGR